jgi:uncharacterized protein YdhG (YjbR/CyaY superfamily)
MMTFEEFLSLAKMLQPQRSTLETVWERIHSLYADVEEGMHYGIAEFKVHGTWVAGMAARRGGCSYYPMSGKVIDHLNLEKLGMARTSGALRFAKDKPLPKALIKRLIELRLAEKCQGSQHVHESQAL